MNKEFILILLLGFSSKLWASGFEYYTFIDSVKGCPFESFNFTTYDCSEYLSFPKGSHATVIKMKNKEQFLGKVIGSEGEYLFEKNSLQKKAKPGHFNNQKKSISDINSITSRASKTEVDNCPPSLNKVKEEKQNPRVRAYYQTSAGNYLDYSTQYRSSSRKNKASIAKGTGARFTDVQVKRYCQLKKETTTKPKTKLQWELRNLDDETIVAGSKTPEKIFYGASVSKVFVAGAYLNSVKGNPSESGKQELMNMIVESNNSSWGELQKRAGGGVTSGMKEVDRFLKKDLGIEQSTGFRGDLGDRHGNEISTSDLSSFMQKTFNGDYPGSQDLLKTMYLSRTGSKRGKKYFPSNMIVGGKTGTYKGATRLEGRGIQSKSNHHTMIFEQGGKSYSLSVLSDPGDDETVAILTGGVIRDYLGVDGGLSQKCN